MSGKSGMCKAGQFSDWGFEFFISVKCEVATNQSPYNLISVRSAAFHSRSRNFGIGEINVFDPIDAPR
jgi:hypothetical protein